MSKKSKPYPSAYPNSDDLFLGQLIVSAPFFHTIKEHSLKIEGNPYSEAFCRERDTRLCSLSHMFHENLSNIRNRNEQNPLKRKRGNHENLAGHRLGK